jgi:predicted Rossmann fold flavoprotein
MLDLQNSIIVGGGMAGLAAAVWVKEQNSGQPVKVVEREDHLLPWIGGKGRGPLVLGTASTTALDEATYPVGKAELLRVLERWPGSSTRDWLSSLGLEIQETATGMFVLREPECLRKLFNRVLDELGVERIFGFAVESISPQPDGGFRIWSKAGDTLAGRNLLIATGGERNHGLKLASELGAGINPVLPAFLRLRLASPKLGERLGPMERQVGIRCLKSGEVVQGTIQLSARGLEGPAVSELSARQCELWNHLGYRFRLEIDWLPDLSGASVRNQLISRCERGGRRLIGTEAMFGFSEKQWRCFLKLVRIEEDLPWARLKSKKVQALSQRLKADILNFAGMGLPAGERAWAGGIDPDSMNCGSFESLNTRDLFFAGEIIDALGLPGGFHPNLTWATAYQAGCSMGIASCDQ